MKVKIFALVAAFFMLMGGSAWAQSDVKGDVNKDGVVNEQDIAAILAIMAKNNGVAEKTKYYWYVGQTKPTSMTSDPTPDDTNFTNNKWHTLAKDATSIAKTITGGTSGNAWYIAVPKSFGFKPTATDLATPNNTWSTEGTIIINNVEYTLWKPSGTSSRQAVYMAKI